MLRIFIQLPFFYKVCLIFLWLYNSLLEQLSPGIAYVTTTWIRLAVDFWLLISVMGWEGTSGRIGLGDNCPMIIWTFKNEKHFTLFTWCCCDSKDGKIFFIHFTITWTFFSNLMFLALLIMGWFFFSSIWFFSNIFLKTQRREKISELWRASSNI